MGSLWFGEGAEPGLAIQGLDSEHRMEEEPTSVQVRWKGLSLWLSYLFQSMTTALCLSVTRGKHRTELSLLRASARGKTANTKRKASLWSCPFLIPSIFFSLSPLFLPPCLYQCLNSGSVILALNLWNTFTTISPKYFLWNVPKTYIWSHPSSTLKHLGAHQYSKDKEFKFFTIIR